MQEVYGTREKFVNHQPRTFYEATSQHFSFWREPYNTMCFWSIRTRVLQYTLCFGPIGTLVVSSFLKHKQHMFSSIMQCWNFKGLTLWEFAYRQRQAHEEKNSCQIKRRKIWFTSKIWERKLLLSISDALKVKPNTSMNSRSWLGQIVWQFICNCINDRGDFTV